MVFAGVIVCTIRAKEFYMKKIVVGLIMSVVLAGGLFAAGAQDSVTVEGKLVVKEGVPTITENGKTWVIPSGPFYRVAWENGLKTGDTLKVDGFDKGTQVECEIEGASLLVPSKVWVNGKELDVSATAGRGYRREVGPMKGGGHAFRNDSQRRGGENGFRNRR